MVQLPVTELVMCSSMLLTFILLFVRLPEQVDAFMLASPYTVGKSASTKRSVRSDRCIIQQQTTIHHRLILLNAEERGNNDDISKKKRRRKQPAMVTEATPDTAVSQIQLKSISEEQVVDDAYDNDAETQSRGVTINNNDIAMMNDIAKYEFKNKMDAPTVGTIPNIMESKPLLEPTQSSSPSSSSVSGAIQLPDIKEARKRKQMEEEVARMQQEQEEQKVRIKRTDKEAFRRLLEQQPFADADESYFEEEQYGAVSALLGERAKPFLSIPLGPLQAGHFIGSLVFVLMAYIEYPGFPLTNLPTPLRMCFQGGLGLVYAINIILAIIVAVKVAPDRGQPLPLWIMKTFTVGGLAFDQLMQQPTLVEIEKANAVKGARAIKKKQPTR